MKKVISVYFWVHKKKHPVLLKASRSSASLHISPQDKPIFAVSFSRSRLQVFLGLPFFLLPWGFHVSACRAMLSGLLSVCPTHFHFLIVMSSFIGVCLVCSHNAVLLISSGQKIFRIFLKHVLMKLWSFLIGVSFILHVSQP